MREIHAETIAGWLSPRPVDSHKGMFGAVGIIGGSPGMAGAALLAGRAALHLGAGRVYVGLLDDRLAVDGAAPELMLTGCERALRIARPGCLVLGPGLGTSEGARHWLHAAIHTEMPLLIDADGLNLLALDSTLRAMVKYRVIPTLLTPHPGEAARLLGKSTAEVQADRNRAGAALVEQFHCVVALKGAGTLVLAPDKEAWRNTSGNPGMAAPGMGDVLSGMVAALIAQGLDAERAAVLAVYLHGAAADTASAAGQGPVGLTAGEVIQAARRRLNDWIYP